MPTASSARARTRSADPPRPARLSADRLAAQNAATEASRRSKSPTPESATPLYVVAEDTAKRKYMTFLRHREQLSARRRIGDPLASSPPASPPPTAPTVARQHHTPQSSRDFARGSSQRSPQASAEPLASPPHRFASRPVDEEAAAPSRTPNPVEGLSQFELTEMVLQLQTALTSARKENMQLRLQLRSRGIEVQESHASGRALGVNREYIVTRFNQGTQTALSGSVGQPSNDCSSPSPSRAMDRIDFALEERRSKRLERLLVERTFKMGDLETMCRSAEEEAETLRAKSAEREVATTQLREENGRLSRQLQFLEEKLMVAERGLDQAEAATRNDGVLKLELATMQSTLAAKEAEAVELHGLCDYLHAQCAQLRAELDTRMMFERESERRRRLVAEWQSWSNMTVRAYFVGLAKLRRVNDEPPSTEPAPDG
uniref:Uncharacterized protein n=1 Tax=Neobodo designis TaxID=312471 RepID=A0A7S1MEV2_NEODS